MSSSEQYKTNAGPPRVDQNGNLMVCRFSRHACATARTPERTVQSYDSDGSRPPVQVKVLIAINVQVTR